VLARQRKKRREHLGFCKKFEKFDQWKILLPGKTHKVKQGGCQKLPQPGKYSAIYTGRTVDCTGSMVYTALVQHTIPLEPVRSRGGARVSTVLNKN
jgi:hypothetical protein